MPIAEKVLATIMNTRLMAWNKKNNIISDIQGAFQIGKGPEDTILLLKMLVNTAIKKKKGAKCYLLKLDVEKAFDRIWRKGLWNHLWNIGIRGKFWRVMRTLYKNTLASIKIGGIRSRTFKIKQGVKQGCALSSTLFNMFVQILIEKLESTKKGVTTHDGRVIPAIVYADDVYLIAETRDDFEILIRSYEEFCKYFRVSSNPEKTKYIIFRKRPFK